MYWSRKQRKTLPTPCHCFQIMLKVTQESLFGVKKHQDLRRPTKSRLSAFPQMLEPVKPFSKLPNVLRFYYEHRSEVSGKQRNQKTANNANWCTHMNNNAYSSKTLSRLTATRLLSRHQRVQQLSPAANEDLMVCTSGLMICETKKRSASYWNISNWKCQGLKFTIMPFCSWKYFSINFTMFIITVWFISISIYNIQCAFKPFDSWNAAWLTKRF